MLDSLAIEVVTLFINLMRIFKQKECWIIFSEAKPSKINYNNFGFNCKKL